jgi:hypothetical protein
MNNKNLHSRLNFLSVFLVFSLLFSVFLPFLDVFAYRMVYKSFVATEPSKIEFIGEQKGENFGASVASGDVNRDRIDDLIVGSPYYSSDGKTWNGKVSVFFGKKSLDKRVYDMKSDSPDLVIYGKNSGDQLGISVASGDFNNDGYDDVLIGAYSAQSNSGRTGKAYLIFGRNSYDDKGLSLETTSADIELVGDQEGDAYGLVVYLKDISGDNFDDILVGAPFAMSTGGVGSGDVYGYFGYQHKVDSVYGHSKLFGERDADVVFEGHAKDERFGSAIVVGDVVGMTYNDIIISAYYANSSNGEQSGKIYIYRGVKNYKKHIYEAYDVLVGERAYDWLGFSIDVGNINKDDKDDLVVSTFPYLNKDENGKIYVLNGREMFNESLASSDFANSDGTGESGVVSDVFVPGNSDKSVDEYIVSEETANYYFKGGREDNLAGSSVALADLDNDKKMDFVIGAPGVNSPKSPNPGEVYLFYQRLLDGKYSFNVKNDEATTYISGENPDDWFGAKLTTLDFNHDGYSDIAVSSRYADRYDPKTGLVSESNNGAVYILLGHSVPFGDPQALKEPTDEYVTRGEFIKTVVEDFDIANTRKDFIDNCYSYREFCFFVFSGYSTFSGIKLSPNIVLYPDIPYGSKYYKPVTIATMLGLVNGFVNEENTPFKPDDYITRVQALKIILSANQLVAPMYKFELISELGSVDAIKKQESRYSDVNPAIPSMWWYPRFTNFAYEHNLVDEKIFFRPDDNLTRGEFDVLLERTLEFLNPTKA